MDKRDLIVGSFHHSSSPHSISLLQPDLSRSWQGTSAQVPRAAAHHPPPLQLLSLGSQGCLLCLFPLTHHSWAVFCWSLQMLSLRCHHLVCWAQPCPVVGVLEMARPGMGQPWGLLTEAALQPPTSTRAPAPSTVSGEGSHYVLSIYFSRPGIRHYVALKFIPANSKGRCGKVHCSVIGSSFCIKLPHGSFLLSRACWRGSKSGTWDTTEPQRWVAGEENRQRGITHGNILSSALRFVWVLSHHPSHAPELLTPVESPLRTIAFPGHRSLQHLAGLPRLEHPIDCTATLKWPISLQPAMLEVALHLSVLIPQGPLLVFEDRMAPL